MNRLIEGLIRKYAENPLKLLEEVGGFYEVIKDPKTGKRLTPLVGYAGKYDANDGKELQYVGEVYANFAKAEEHPLVMEFLTAQLWEKLKFECPVVFVGPAMGGISVAQFLALHASKEIDARYACAEKIVTRVKTKDLREQSELQFARHTINPGDNVVVCEDVLNNFATTSQLIELVEKQGATVIAITGLLNRSNKINLEFVYEGQSISVFSLVRKPFDQYKQEDLEVIEDIVNENVVLKPKNEWHLLKDAIQKTQS